MGEDRENASGAQARRAGVAGAVRRHLPFGILLALAAILRLLTLLAYRPGLEYVQDSFSYLYDAYHLVPNVIRPSGYSLFLRLIQATDRFWLITAVQHVLGLATGVLLYLLLLRLGVGRWLATAGATPVLVDGYQVYIGQFVMPETLFQALVVTAVVLLLWSPQPGIGRFALAGVALGAAAVTRTVGLALLAAAVAIFTIRRSGWRPLVALAAAGGLIVGAYGLWFRSSTGHFGLERYDGYFLAGTAQTFADCRELRLPPDEAIFCDPRPVEQRPGPDWYVHTEDAPLRRRDGVPGPVRDRAAARFGKRVILHQPLDYLSHVRRNFLHYLSPRLAVRSTDNPLQTWQFLTSYHAAPWQPLYPPADPYNTNWTWPGEEVQYQVVLARWGFGLAEQQATLDPSLARGLRSYQRLGYIPGSVLALCLLIVVVSAFGRVRPGLRHLRSSALVLGSFGLLVLLMPSAIASFDYRYRLPAIALLPPAGVLGVALVRRRRAAQPHRGG